MGQSRVIDHFLIPGDGSDSPIFGADRFCSDSFECLSVHDKGRQNARCAPAALSQISRAYFGSGSDAKFAWTNVHLSPFFTYTRVDFARFGAVFPSLSWVTPT